MSRTMKFVLAVALCLSGPVLSQEVFPDSIRQESYEEGLSIRETIIPEGLTLKYSLLHSDWNVAPEPLSLNVDLSTWQPPAFDQPVGPVFNDFQSRYSLYSLNRKSWLNTSSLQSQYMGIGTMNLVRGGYNYLLGDFGVATGGLYATKYTLYGKTFNDAGFNANLRFDLTDWLKVNAFGEYSLGGSQNYLNPMISPFYPQTSFGGSLEFKVTDNWGVMVGNEREFDIVTRKWVNRPFIMPVFYNR
jgi:hypothetical protein